MSTMSEPTKLEGICFYVSVDDSPISSTRTSELDAALAFFLKKEHIYKYSDYMKNNKVDSVKLSLKCRYNDKDKPITLKEENIILV